jgi:hypothetical protein
MYDLSHNKHLKLDVSLHVKIPEHVTFNAMPELIINSKQTISGVQQQFNDAFQFLKLEFFNQPPISGIGNAKNKMIIRDMKLNEIQILSKSGKIIITNNMTVSSLEKCFINDFGLYVQVFRKSGKIWLETTATDNWTLEQQNEEGKSLAEHLNIKHDNPDDHDIY